MRKLLLGLALGAIVLSLEAQAALLENGNFKDGPNCAPQCGLVTGSTAIKDWTIQSGTIDFVRNYWQSPPGGGNSIDLDGVNPGVITQTFSTIPNQFYKANFYMSGNPAEFVSFQIVKMLQVTAGSSSGLFEYDTHSHSNSYADMGYVAVSFEFAATSSATQLSFIIQDAVPTYTGPVLGDVSVAPLPSDGEYQIHAFSGAAINGDGATPTSPLTADGKGVLYGTTQGGGGNQCTNAQGAAVSCGTLYSLTPNSNTTGWTEQVLFSFDPQSWSPSGQLMYQPKNGLLYGASTYGGSGCGGPGCGAVFSLTAPGGSGSSSAQTVLYQFQGGADGGLPNGRLLQDDTVGVLYGTTRQGGTTGCGGAGCGVVFMLTPTAFSSWEETPIYSSPAAMTARPLST